MNAALAGRYQLERELGAGGMATVFLARDLKHDREVAIKVLRADLSAVLGAERFLAEVRITARLDHPHILTLIDSGEADGILYYVLPVVRGESLRARLQREKQLGIDDAIALTRQVASALDYAHAQGVVHRDIKPENILIHQGEAVLTDFGIALAVREAGGNRLTETGLSLGTPQYMSPEQATGDRTLDARSDVYSLAAVLYEMLGGEPPVTGATAQAMIAKLLMEKPTSLRVVRDTVPDGVDRAISRGLAKVPADRFASAGEFVRALDAGAGSAGPPRKSRSPLIGAAAVVAVAVIGALGWRTFAARSPAHVTISLGDRKQVTFNGRALWTAISDDGKSVAYSVEECAPTGCTYALEVQDVGSPTTRRIVSGSVHQVSNFKWSPDRRSILYRGDVAGEWCVALVSALGGPPLRLAPVPVNEDFYGPDSLVILDPRSPRDLLFAGLDGTVHDRVPVVDAAEKLTVGDVMFVPESRWFIAALENATGTQRFRVIDRSGRRSSESADVGQQAGLEWASADALWRMMRTAEATGRNVLLRNAFDSKSGKLSATADTVYAGTASYFDVTRDGSSIVLSEGSTTYDSWAGDLRDLVRGQLSPARKLESTTTPGYSMISPDGQRVLVVRSLAPRFDASVRPFGGGAAFPLSLFDATGARWVDSVSLMFVRPRGARVQLGLMDVRTGAVRDTLLLPADVSRQSLAAFSQDPLAGGIDAVGQGGWIWKTRTGPLMLQRRGEPAPHVVPLPGNVGGVTGLRASADGRHVAVAVSSPDSSVIIVMNVDGSSPTVWARRGVGLRTLIMYGELTGFVDYQSVFALDGPGRARLVGTAPRPGMISVSGDLKRAAFTSSEYHGDAWLTKVVRR